MAEYRGWLLDVYGDEQEGLILWLLGEDGERRRFSHSFPITFYAAGPFPRLRQLWRYVRSHPFPTRLERARRKDLFSGELDVLAIQVLNPVVQPQLFQDVIRQFPDLDYYDADIPLALRFGVAHELFPLAHCHVIANDQGQVEQIATSDSPWNLDPPSPPLKIFSIEPNADPFHAKPDYLIIQNNQTRYHLSLKPHRLLLIQLQANLKRHDPDIVLTRWGDTWLFPYLMAAGKEVEGITFNPNRDPKRQVLQRKENSYFTYGRVVYRGRQIHLFGRWHIDQHNAMMFGEYGLEGVFEQARVTGLPVQEIARKSPGSGVTAMQMKTALRQEILIPYQKQQSESFKTALELIRSDRGGMVYQPIIGLHHDVAEIDFVSMYPSIMVRFNVSPETVGTPGGGEHFVPELEIPIDQADLGLVPRTLWLLLAKRIAIKQRLASLNHHDCRYKPLQARSAALKWLLVVCFGYLGYKNARFGRIESHEAVTAYGREALLRAKEAAEEMGYTVLHMYVDGLWVRREGTKPTADFQPLLDEIVKRTGLPIALEGIYRWVAFLPSRADDRVPVANRYFGVFQDGKIKTRGIEVRRHDTPFFVAQMQMNILHRLAKVPPDQPLLNCLPDLIAMLRQGLADLRARQIPLTQLLVSQTLSRPPDEYRMPSPAGLAAVQLQAVGQPRRPGQRIRFLYTYGRPGVHAWDLPIPPDPATVDVARYTELLVRAAFSVLQPLGVDETVLRDWLLGDAFQTCFQFFNQPIAYQLERPQHVSSLTV